MDRRLLTYGLVAFALALLLRLALAALWYSDDLGVSRFQSGDYLLYDLGAEQILAQHDFSNSLFLARPPLFPLLVAALGQNEIAVLLVDALLGALIAPLTLVLARQLGFESRAALLAGVIIAIDPASVVYSAYMGPEPLANLLLVAMALCLLVMLHTPRIGAALVWGVFAGAALTLSALARPATYMLWPVLGLALLIVRRRLWLAALLFAVVSAAGVFVWTAHNGAVFGNATFSTVGPYTQLYCRAASIEHFATNREMRPIYIDLNQRVAERVGWEGEVTSGTRYEFYAATPEIQSAMQSVAIEVFLKYPQWFIATLPIGLGRMYGWTNTLPNWFTPIEIVWNLAFYLCAAWGMWSAFRHKHWLLFIGVGLIVGYYTVGTLWVANACMDTRMRSMLTPFLAVAATYALALARKTRVQYTQNETTSDVR
jgi:hypothetical protein